MWKFNWRTGGDSIDFQPDYYNDFGCCLACEPDWKEEHLLEPDNDSKGSCLCKKCLCRQCYWYEPDYSGDYGWSEGGSCEYPRQKHISQNHFSIHKIKRVIKVSEKAIYAEIEGIVGCHWIPLSCINEKEQIKMWFINKLNRT